MLFSLEGSGTQGTAKTGGQGQKNKATKPGLGSMINEQVQCSIWNVIWDEVPPYHWQKKLLLPRKAQLTSLTFFPKTWYYRVGKNLTLLYNHSSLNLSLKWALLLFIPSHIYLTILMLYESDNSFNSVRNWGPRTQLIYLRMKSIFP